MKPSWDDAPSWAQWLAMDKDGDWFWYEKEPDKFNRGWFEWDGGRCEQAFFNFNWSKSKERRP